MNKRKTKTRTRQKMKWSKETKSGWTWEGVGRPAKLERGTRGGGIAKCALETSSPRAASPEDRKTVQESAVAADENTLRRRRWWWRW
jgi:hypothetical protein